MTERPLPVDDLSPLLAALCDGTVDDDGLDRLQRRLSTDPAARRCYIAYMDLHGELCWNYLPHAAATTETDPETVDVPPVITIDASPVASPPWYSFEAPVGRLLRLYGIAAAAVAVLVAVGLMYRVSRYAPENAETAGGKPFAHGKAFDLPEGPVVAHVTGLSDCGMADGVTLPLVNASVSVGHKFALTSGYMELTCNAGAKVILEGPCEYEVESARGGFLSLGKLTARIVASGEWPVASRKGSGTRDQGPGLGVSRQTSLATGHSPLATFTVRTPTAMVTDLGTEFGVEVFRDRRNAIRVYQGRIAVASAKIAPREHGGVIVVAGQCASLDAKGAVTNVDRVEPRDGMRGTRIVVTDFVRQLPKPGEANAQLDLLDIVAGGDGLGRRRGVGIDPITGEKAASWNEKLRIGRGYQRVAWNPLVDGVFVPHSSARPVQLDSAGHVFSGLTSPVGRTHITIYAWPKTEMMDTKPPIRWFQQVQKEGRYAAEPPGQLLMHADSGITFDLAAIRKAHPDIARLLRFRSVAGIAHTGGVADVWAFVDGRLAWKSRWCTEWADPAYINIPLRPDTRFLTLVVTDSDDDVTCDYVVFLAPTLDAVAKQEKKTSKAEQ